MKKKLFLTALLSSIMLGVISCSDDEKFIEEYPEDIFPAYGITAELSYDESNDRFIVLVDEETDKFIFENVAIFKSVEQRDKYMKGDHIFYVNEDASIFGFDSNGEIRAQFMDLVGSKFTTKYGLGSVRPGDDVYEYGLKISFVHVPTPVTARGKDDVYIVDDQPQVFPEAYMVPILSRSSNTIDGLYDVINVYVHVLRKTDGTGLNKEAVTTEILGRLNDFHNANSTHIKFQCIGSEYLDILTTNMINNWDLANDNESGKLFCMNNHINALDIYYLSYWEKMYKDGWLLG